MSDRKWNPDEDDYPTRSITFDQLAQRLDRKLPKHAEPTAIHREVDLGTSQFPEPSIHWIESWQGRSICFDTVKGAEKICREEAERLGFGCVVIRSGVHAKTNQHAEDGSVLTEYNARTGTYTNVVADDDPHITVYMGWNLDELLVAGHIYIVWDHKAMFNMRRVKGPEERKIVVKGRSRLASEYWPI